MIEIHIQTKMRRLNKQYNLRVFIRIVSIFLQFLMMKMYLPFLVAFHKVRRKKI